MQILITGANGLLGSNLIQRTITRDHETVGTYHTTVPSFSTDLHQLDIRNQDQFRSLVKQFDPEVVVNCAAMTDVDGCEKNCDRARVVNGQAPGNLASVCAEEGIRFVHVSTDYVFNGETSTPYQESAETNPIQVYGSSKLQGEKNVQAVDNTALIVRLSFVYGVHGATGSLIGFPAWVQDRLQEGESVPLFDDQYITPSRAGQAAETILAMLNKGLTGTYHVACRSCVTPYQFGVEIQERLDADPALLSRSSQSTVSRSADRPSYSCLDVSSLESALGRKQPTLSEDIGVIV